MLLLCIFKWNRVFGIHANIDHSKMIFGRLPSKTSYPKAMGANGIIGEKIRQAERKFNESQKTCENNYDLYKKDD